MRTFGRLALLAGALLWVGPVIAQTGTSEKTIGFDFYTSAVEEVLRFPADDPCEEISSAWVAAIRLLPGWDDPESLWVLTVKSNGQPELAVTRVIGDSLWDQYQDWDAPPNAKVADFAARVRTETTTITSANCPQLKKLRDKFLRLRVPVLGDNVLSLHDDRLQFYSDNCLSEPVRFTVKRVEGSYWGELPGPHPLLAWFDQLVSAEAKCGRPKQSR